MPGTIIETHGSGSYSLRENAGSATLTYFVCGESDEAAVHLLVLDTAPERWFSFVREELNCKRRNALDQWDVTVNYKLLPFAIDVDGLPTDPSFVGPTGDPILNPAPSPSPSSSPPPDDVLLDGVTFSVSLENEHIDLSEGVVTSAVKTGPDTVAEWNDKYGDLIGVVEDGNGGVKVMGTERGSPIATVRRKATIEGMTHRYFRTLMKMCGRTNFAPWWIFGTEDAQFVGVEGQQLDRAGKFDMSFEFLHRQPIEDKVWGTVPSSTGGADLDLVATKRGMQFIAFGYKEVEVDGRFVMRVAEVFVHRIHKTDDFNYLGI